MIYNKFSPHLVPTFQYLFCRKEKPPWKKRLFWSQKCKKTQKNTPKTGFLEAPPGFEPGSQGFADPCLTTWLWRQKKQRGAVFGAGNEIRTRDIHLGKVALYH